MPTATPPSRKTGLAFKLTLCILSGAMLIFCAAFAYNYHYSKELILKNVRERAKNLTDSALYRIESVIDDGEQVPGFLAYILETAPPDDDHLKQYLKDFVKASPSVFGSTAAFEPYSFDAREKLYAPYFYKSGDFLEYSLLGQHDNYDYLRMDWYVIPKELGKPVWSASLAAPGFSGAWSRLTSPWNGSRNSSLTSASTTPDRHSSSAATASSSPPRIKSASCARASSVWPKT